MRLQTPSEPPTPVAPPLRAALRFNQTVERSSLALDRTFAALGDATRRAILSRLRGGPLPVTALAEPFAISLAAVSKHVQVLERAGLVRRTVVGREHRIALHAAPLREATDWISRYESFWSKRLDALDDFLRARRRGTPRLR